MNFVHCMPIKPVVKPLKSRSFPKLSLAVKLQVNTLMFTLNSQTYVLHDEFPILSLAVKLQVNTVMFTLNSQTYVLHDEFRYRDHTALHRKLSPGVCTLHKSPI